MSVEFTSSDLSDVEQFLTQRYARVRLSSRCTSATALYRSTDLDDFSIDQAALGFDFDYDFVALDTLCFIRVRGGRISRVRDKQAEAFSAGHVYSAGPADQPHRGTVRGTRFTSLRVSPLTLSRVLLGPEATHGRPLELQTHTVATSSAQRRFCTVFDHVHDAILTEPAMRREPLMVSAATHYLAAGVLSCFGSRLTGRVPADRRDARSSTVRRAREFMADRAHLPITLGEVAAAASVSPRALQLAFRDNLQTTPMTYLRQQRLALARAALTEAEPTSGMSVRSIAARYGFAGPSRFSALYRATYQETPTQTLRAPGPASRSRGT